MIQLTAHKNKKNGGVKMKISKKVKKNLIFVVSLAFILTNCYFLMFGIQTVEVAGITEPKLASEVAATSEGGGIMSEAIKDDSDVGFIRSEEHTSELQSH